MRREHGGAEHPIGRLLAEVGQPVVVGPGDGRRVGGLEAIAADLLAGVEAEHEQAAAREHHRQVEALGVHGANGGRGVPVVRLGIGVDRLVLVAPSGLAAVDVLRSHGTEAQQRVVLHPHPHVARQLGEPDRRGVAYSGAM